MLASTNIVGQGFSLAYVSKPKVYPATGGGFALLVLHTVNVGTPA